MPNDDHVRCIQSILELLRSHDAPHQVLEHEAVYTSKEAARVRGTSLASGAKALVCKADGKFLMFVMPADRKLASRAVRTTFGWKKLRFASRDEVQELTGLLPGSIPPFGHMFQLETIVDQALAQQASINFNAGDHCRSVSMAYEDYERVERPRVESCAE